MSIFLSTCSLISSSVSVITGVKQINAKVATILQPHKGLRVSEKDRRRLVAIHKRVECLIQPLNFCVMWAKDKDSCIQPIIQYAYDLVQSVTEFLDKVKFVADEVDPFTRVLEAESSQKVDHFLRELDFACNSVSMAVSITKSIGAVEDTRQVSPSALLKASLRISEMTARSGDLFAINGTLYKRDPGDSEWKLASSDCVLRLTQLKSVDPSDSPYLIRVSLPNEIATSGLHFPVHVALSCQVSTVKSLGLPIASLTDSLVVAWKYCDSAPPQKRRVLHRNPSGNMDSDLSRLSLDSSDNETILVHGAADVPASLRPRISSTHISGPEAAAEYAFAYSDLTLSPLDVVYIARLCVLEATRQPLGIGSPGSEGSMSSPKQASLQPLHLEASDETLVALLTDSRAPIILTEDVVGA